MKKRKWWKPVITIGVIVAVIAIAAVSLMKYLESRSVQLTKTDVLATVNFLSGYLIALGVILAICAVAAIAVVKLPKARRSLARTQAGVAAVLAVVVIVNMVCMGPEYGIINNLFAKTYYLSDDTVKASEQLVKDIADEGIVMLKNEDGMLPLDGEMKLNVFGWSSVGPVYGGIGSGAVDENDCLSLLKGLEDAGFVLNGDIEKFYRDFLPKRPEVNIIQQNWTIPEPTMEEYDAAGVFENAKAFSDTAVVVLARIGGENADLPTSITEGNSDYADDLDPSKSYLELSNRESAMLDRVCKEFDNVIVVYNGANAMEMGFVEEYDSIKAALWMAGPGETGFASLGRILNGSVNPSGKLVDTFVYDLQNIPAIHYVGDIQYDFETSNALVATKNADWLYASFNNYVEGIYVGYKFYETAAAEGLISYDEVVQYPFGYGLSYTSFEQEISDVTDNGDDVALSVTVKNTGTVAGKDVVEVYYEPPYYNGGIEKAAVNLIDFEKTKVLEPGESQDVSFTIQKEELASYDYGCVKSTAGAYVLESGTYTISINSDSHHVLDSVTFDVEKDIIYDDAHEGKRESDEQTAVNVFDYAAGDVTYLSRADHFANYDEATAAPTDFSMSEELQEKYYCQNNYDPSEYDETHSEMPVTGAKNGLTIRDMEGLAYEDEKWEDLLDQLTVDDMVNLVGNGSYASAKVESIHLPAMIECDGPAAIKNNYTGQAGTAYPAAVMLAATWNKELATRRGESMGQQCEDMNVTGWYGPAMNIHRTAFSGRNFEYYSEDGVLSGRMGACEVVGARKYGVQCYVKHFALNDSETNRGKLLATWCDEQSMREIYLKPFEMAVKDGGTINAMSSFNYIGHIWAGANSDLQETVLRDEWGFRGSIVTDWFSGSYDGYMLADSAIRTGGDKMLAVGDELAQATHTENAGTVNALRNASHNILYSIANSNAMNERNFQTPSWVTTFYVADAVILLLLVLWEVLAIRAYRKAKS